MKLALILLIALFIPGCHHSREEVQQIPSHSLSGTTKILSPTATQKSVLAISEITIEREPGLRLHPSPDYALTLRNDGTATYIGAAFTERLGTYRATIPLPEFIRLARLVEDSGFVGFEPFYGPAADDIDKVSISVVRKGKRKTVMDWGKPDQPEFEKEAPASLKQIENQIDAVVANARWVKVSNKTQAPQYMPEFTDEK